MDQEDLLRIRDPVIQTQDSKFEPWRSVGDHATSRSRRLSTKLNLYESEGQRLFISLKPEYKSGGWERKLWSDLECIVWIQQSRVISQFIFFSWLTWQKDLLMNDFSTVIPGVTIVDDAALGYARSYTQT